MTCCAFAQWKTITDSALLVHDGDELRSNRNKQAMTTDTSSQNNGYPDRCHRGYGLKEFREDLKAYMMKVAVEGVDTAFIFTGGKVGILTRHC